jgi:hypothetical protein
MLLMHQQKQKQSKASTAVWPCIVVMAVHHDVDLSW